MFILLLLIGLIILGALLFGVFKLVKWLLIERVRVKWAISILVVLVASFVIKKMFFTKMEFIQSKVYTNLYIVKNPAKENLIVKKAILAKIKAHLNAKPKTGKELSYSGKSGIYFYEYGGMTFGFLGEAGTGYFIDHEEDFGGFVSEELGMYQEYRLAEFYYNSCRTKPNLICGELDVYSEGTFIKTHTINQIEILK